MDSFIWPRNTSEGVAIANRSRDITNEALADSILEFVYFQSRSTRGATEKRPLNYAASDLLPAFEGVGAPGQTWRADGYLDTVSVQA